MKDFIQKDSHKSVGSISPWSPLTKDFMWPPHAGVGHCSSIGGDLSFIVFLYSSVFYLFLRSRLKKNFVLFHRLKLPRISYKYPELPQNAHQPPGTCSGEACYLYAAVFYFSLIFFSFSYFRKELPPVIEVVFFPTEETFLCSLQREKWGVKVSGAEIIPHSSRSCHFFQHKIRLLCRGLTVSLYGCELTIS